MLIICLVLSVLAASTDVYIGWGQPVTFTGARLRSVTINIELFLSEHLPDVGRVEQGKRSGVR
jgi:hypothetical protein